MPPRKAAKTTRLLRSGSRGQDIVDVNRQNPAGDDNVNADETERGPTDMNVSPDFDNTHLDISALMAGFRPSYVSTSKKVKKTAKPQSKAKATKKKVKSQQIQM